MGKRKLDDVQVSPTGKGKKEKKEKTSPIKRIDGEGKVVKYRSTAPVAIQERMARALPGSGHRMFLVDRTVITPVGASEDGPIEEFAVLGATGNVYLVRIGCHLSCTCPDFARHGGPCKHIAYVMLRVLRLRADQPEVWQKALLPSEAEQVLSGQLSTRAEEDVLAERSVRDAYRRATEGGTTSDSMAGKQRPIEGDCPVCYDEMKPSASKKDKVIFCTTCGNNVHEECFTHWAASKRKQHAPVTCIWCRAPWDGAGGGNVGEQMGHDGGYINLASTSSAHRNLNQNFEDLYGEEGAYWLQRARGRRGRH